jgi:probable F420-dependent oxidoreductase
VTDADNGATVSPVTPPSDSRFGITIPFDGVSLRDHRRWFEELADLGYTDIWSAEVDGSDGFTPLALAAAWVPALQLGVAITPAFTRGPALLAQSVAAMAEAAPGHFMFGLGASSEVIVEQWNGIRYTDPYQKVRDTLRFLRAAFTGEKITADYATFSVKGFRLGRPVEDPPPIYLGALRAGMLGLAGREADGAILNWLSADDVPTAVHEVGPGKEIVARIFVCPNPDPDVARAVGRRMIAAYLNVPAYADFHRWLGRGPQLQAMWDAWGAGDRKGALAAIPDEVVDALVVHGSTEACREHVARYVKNGVTIPAMMVVPFGVDLAEVVRGLSPSA